jgi:hypothetical protein
MSVQETVLGYRFLIGILSVDSTLIGFTPGGVWRGFAPVKTVPPFTIVAYQSGTDTLTTAGVRPLSRLLYQCKATGLAGNTQAIEDAASQIDELLGGNEGLRNQTIDGGFVGSCYRDGTISTDRDIAGTKWTTIGGLYRVDIQQTT